MFDDYLRPDDYLSDCLNFCPLFFRIRKPGVRSQNSEFLSKLMVVFNYSDS